MSTMPICSAAVAGVVAPVDPPVEMPVPPAPLHGRHAPEPLRRSPFAAGITWVAVAGAAPVPAPSTTPAATPTVPRAATATIPARRCLVGGRGCSAVWVMHRGDSARRGEG